MKKRWPWLLLLLLILLGLLLGALLLTRNTDSGKDDPTVTADPTENTPGPEQTDAPTQPPTDMPTQPPTEGPTDAPTEPPTEPPTEAPTQPNTCSHSWSAWTTQAATCDTNGVKTRKCSKCSKEETETIAATGHNWDSGKVTTTPTNCSDIGVKTYFCSNCGDTKSEQITGNHAYSEWEWEEYTYTVDYGYTAPGGSQYATYTSHRKVRTCTNCGFRETNGTDHNCQRGSKNHTVSIVSEPVCGNKGIKRSTCKICGWYIDFEYGITGAGHTWVEKKVHLSDYTEYTNELDATIGTCSVCGFESVIYHHGKGYGDYYRWKIPVSISKGDAYAGSLPVNDDMTWVNHPEWQMVTRDHVYDSEGYVKQFTVYWWYNGTRYSQVIKCDTTSLKDWFTEWNCYVDDAPANATYQFTVKGIRIVPHKITWRG